MSQAEAKNIATSKNPSDLYQDLLASFNTKQKAVLLFGMLGLSVAGGTTGYMYGGDPALAASTTALTTLAITGVLIILWDAWRQCHPTNSQPDANTTRSVSFDSPAN